MQELTDIKELSQAQRERLAHIDFTLLFKGEAGRSYLTERFKVAPSVATQDFARYRELAPKNLTYDEKRRIHLKTNNFKSLFNYDVVRTLATISQGFGDGFLGKIKPPISCEAPFHMNKPSLDIVARISEAIHKGCAVKIEYVSPSSGLSKRIIVPHTLVDNGLRWHVRTYDRKRDDFCDFVLTRIKNVQLLDSKADDDRENIQFDKQWNRIVELEFIPHPRIAHPEAIHMDYGMKGGFLKVEIRASFVGYLLRLWNIDCSHDHSSDGREFQLALKNSGALYGVENAHLAPGYEDGEVDK